MCVIREGVHADIGHAPPHCRITRRRFPPQGVDLTHSPIDTVTRASGGNAPNTRTVPCGPKHSNMLDKLHDTP